MHFQRSLASAAQQYVTPDPKSSDALPTEQSPYMELDLYEQTSRTDSHLSQPSSLPDRSYKNVTIENKEVKYCNWIHQNSKFHALFDIL